MLESVFETGRPTWSEDLLLVLDRNLRHEETYFTFSYSAIVGETGTVDGIFCACAETTERVLSERRLRTLRDLASRASEARSTEEACEIAAQLLGNNAMDIPFALIYLLDHERTVAQLVALSGISSGHQAAPATITLSPSPQKPGWPIFEVAQRATPELVPLRQEEFGTLPGGPWPESPDTALVLPLKAPEQNQVTGFLVVGVNSRRVLDEPYRDFFQLVAGHVATAVSNARAYEEERKRAEALAELDRAKTVFFSNISHEFRTPLTLMLGSIEELVAENRSLSPSHHERIAMLQSNAQRLLKLVNTLLDFSRIEANRIQAVYEPTDLAALTADLASAFRSAIEKAGMQLIVECPPLAEKVYVDHDMWEKIVLNLLSNAFKYTFSGNITVKLRQRGRQVECAVKDTGVGIPAEELPHLFERFYRVKGVEGRTYEGTGIGLSLVQELVKLHGGTIRVQSVRGAGSTFTVSLPLGTAHLPAERSASQPLHASMTAKEQPLLLEISEQLTAWADKPYLRQIVRNLLSNVFKYAPKQTPVIIRAEYHKVAKGETDTPAQVWISVEDAGPGIPTAELPVLFEKFVRLKRDVGGTVRGAGLGLYISKQLVEAMGGHMWVESAGREGEGSRFCFTLPVGAVALRHA